MTDYEIRLTALDRALLGEGNALDYNDVVTRARAFEEYLAGKPDQPTRPLRVGDTVLVAKGAGYYAGGAFCASDIPAPCEATIKELPDRDGDYTLQTSPGSWSYSVAPSYLTLKGTS